MQLQVTATRHYPTSPEKTFDVAADFLRLPEFFTGFGPIPPIVRVEVEGGGAPAPGKNVVAYQSDGVALGHRITALLRGQTVQYTLTGLKPPFSLLVEHGLARWDFTPEGSGTRIDWTYTFPLTSPLAAPLAWPLLRLLMARAMGRCLDNAHRALAG